jgi:hypothetical protein
MYYAMRSEAFSGTAYYVHGNADCETQAFENNTFDHIKGSIWVTHVYFFRNFSKRYLLFCRILLHNCAVVLAAQSLSLKSREPGRKPMLCKKASFHVAKYKTL